MKKQVETTILFKKTTFDGLKLTAEELELMKELNYNSEPETAMNPFSKEEVLLVPEAVALYDLIMGIYACDYMSGDMLTRFCLAKDIFRRNWPKEFMKLLD